MNTTPVILVVDDEPQGRTTLEALLHSSGYRLAFAANGAEALAQTASLTPDLILLDVMMPVMDGFEVCRRLRADPNVAEIPVILLTALDDRDSRLRGIEAGADDFITKPFDRVELRARVRTITRLNRYRRLLLERSKFERLIERAPVGIAIADAQRAIRLANPAFLQMLRAGHATSVIDMDIRSLVAPEQLDACATWLDAVFARLVHVTRVETEFVRLDGERFPVEIDAGHSTWDDQPAVQLIVHDITERKQAEERIRSAAITNARLYTQAERRLAHVQALRTIDMAITTSHDLHTTLEVILDQVAAQLRVDAADVLLLNPQTQMLEYAAGRGFHTAALRQSQLRLGEGPTGRAALERRILSIPDLADATDFRQARLLEDEGFVTYYSAPLMAKAQLQGVLELFHRAPLSADSEWLAFLETLAGQAAIAIENAALFDGLQRSNVELTLAYDTTIEGWSRVLDLRDKETEGHSRRVTGMTLRLADAIGIAADELVHIRRGALLHDIGKMGIPDAILLKPGPLTVDEWAIMRKHPVYAYDMLAPIAYLRPALDIPHCHHEKWDGTGYPRGLAGDQIPLAARIFAVVDVWDAMRSDRPYRKGWSEVETRQHIQSLAGSHFDPRMAQIFLELTP